MPVTPQQIENAKRVQDAAAQDINQTIRLVAGPGTGKSFVIEGRVHWLLTNQGVLPENIVAISFTRAAANDLRDRISAYCLRQNCPGVEKVRVSTLHSLALYILKKAGNLDAHFSTVPVIMDDWELKEIFDGEFAISRNLTPTRSGDIRRDHEAYWSTGQWDPANSPITSTPITQADRTSFNTYYVPRTYTYSCVLPGEVVRTCVDQINAGLIDPIDVLGLQYLIVDEVQDLNPCDFEFIDLLISRGVNVFISGDDDQSVYSFRYAFPQGIQNFNALYPNATNHVLNDCFRCTPAVLNAAVSVINGFPAQGRIPKNLSSVYLNSNPANNGFTQANAFSNADLEALYIARSCQSLINVGVSPKQIMILIGNKKVQLKLITDTLDKLNLEYDANQRDDFRDSCHGRFLASLLRISKNPDDYVAYRVVLGTPDGIGTTVCCQIADKVIANNLNYKNIFYNLLPTGFSTREVRDIERAKSNLRSIQGWNFTETLGQRANNIEQLISGNFSQDKVNEWRNFVASLPLDMTLDEFKDFLDTDSLERKDNIIN